MTDDMERARQRRERRRTTQPAGAFGPSGRKQATIDRVMARVDSADERRDPAAYYAGKTPTRERITTALDLRELYGPEVDEALGGAEPMVDEWEAGIRVPDLTQVQALAELTGFPVRFFYLPPPPPDIKNGWLCGSDGCHPLGGEEDADGEDTGRLFLWHVRRGGPAARRATRSGRYGRRWPPRCFLSISRAGIRGRARSRSAPSGTRLTGSAPGAGGCGRLRWWCRTRGRSATGATGGISGSSARLPRT